MLIKDIAKNLRGGKYALFKLFISFEDVSVAVC